MVYFQPAARFIGKLRRIDSKTHFRHDQGMDMRKMKFIAIGIVVILLGMVIFQNFEEQKITILFATVRMPLALMLLFTFAVGVLAGWLLTFLKASRKQIDKSEL